MTSQEIYKVVISYGLFSKNDKDAYQELFIVLSEISSARLAQLHFLGLLKPICVGILQNLQSGNAAIKENRQRNGSPWIGHGMEPLGSATFVEDADNDLTPELLNQLSFLEHQGTRAEQYMVRLLKARSKCGSTTELAKKLGIQRPTVSNQLKAAREYLKTYLNQKVLT